MPAADDISVVRADLSDQVTLRGSCPMEVCTRPDLKYIGILGKEYVFRTEEAVSDMLWVCGAVVGHRVRRVTPESPRALPVCVFPPAAWPASWPRFCSN